MYGIYSLPWGDLRGECRHSGIDIPYMECLGIRLRELWIHERLEETILCCESASSPRVCLAGQEELFL